MLKIQKKKVGKKLWNSTNCNFTPS